MNTNKIFKNQLQEISVVTVIILFTQTPCFDKVLPVTACATYIHLTFAFAWEGDPSTDIFQRRHTDDQQIQEKMSLIEANQNYNEVSPHPGRMVVIKISTKPKMLERV